MQISVKSNADDVAKQLKGLGKRIPYTIKDGLNSTAFEVQKSLKKDLPKYIDNPTPYTLRGLQVKKATLRELTAVVGFAGGGFGRLNNPGIEPAEYMARLIGGGERRPTTGREALLMPASKQRLNKYGNLTRAARKVGKRAEGRQFFIASERDPQSYHLAPGLYRRMGKSKRIQALILFKQTATYRKQYDFPMLALNLVQRIAPEEFTRQIQRTIDRIAQG